VLSSLFLKSMLNIGYETLVLKTMIKTTLFVDLMIS